MANADINNKEFVVIGELTEDCQFLTIDHYKPLSRLIKHLVGKKLMIGFKMFRQARSDAQNRWLWGVAYVTVAAWWKNTFGTTVDKELLHAYSKQVILKGSDNGVVALTKDEYSSLISEIAQMAKEGRSQADIMKIAEFASRDWLVDMRVEEILGHRVLAEPKSVSSKTMNTKEFSEFKDLLQAHWAEKGCDIPDPRENNLLSDYLEDE